MSRGPHLLHGRRHRRDQHVPPAESGAGSITVLLTVFLTLVLLGATAALGTSVTAAARAAGAADLAALAAADAARGLVAADPCTLAAQTARRHGAELTACTAEGDGTARVQARYTSALPWPAHGQARAGPPAPRIPG
ncbi:Rv3654c family TadE-like protein [Citricoccus sp. NPDC055426]|uniref:Rv3654c family TadE-like protein n=1 Tax=Citricoccus sp. NPDC055426 TaxID=3155536 RepID=UPI003423F326